MRKNLLIIGAGPKALAIAAKAIALSRCGYSTPKITIIEKSRVAAHWAGSDGYTDGKHLLGTSADKDLGFPYSSKEFDHRVDFEVLNSYSWQAFNIKRWSAHPEALESYSESVDRGMNKQPIHQQWAEYLMWVSEQVTFNSEDVEIITGEVTGLAVHGLSWEVTLQTSSRLLADAVVVTGPGPAKKLDSQPDHPRIFDGQTFWRNVSQFADIPWNDEPIGIIGSGETAASVIVALASELKHPVPIYVVNRQGTIFSRGEGYWENHLYTEPEEWAMFSYAERKQIINRTDRGVFSQGAMAFINGLRNVFHKRMEVIGVEIVQDYELESEGRPVIVETLEHHQLKGLPDRPPLRLPVQYAIIAVGFDPWWFVSLFKDRQLQALMNHEYRDILLECMEKDLAFSSSKMPTPKVHVPMLAGLKQGPGFPNLSCLGHLADRILMPYVEKKSSVIGRQLH